jgi:hypothetical protein
MWAPCLMLLAAVILAWPGHPATGGPQQHCRWVHRTCQFFVFSVASCTSVPSWRAHVTEQLRHGQVLNPHVLGLVVATRSASTDRYWICVLLRADCLGLRSLRFIGIAEDADDIERGHNGRIHPFDVSPVQLSELTVPGREQQSLDMLYRLGGGQGICDKLLTDPLRGIDGSLEDLALRREAFGENRFPEPPFESWTALFFDCFKDVILIVLLVAAGVSLVVNTLSNPTSVSWS